MNKTPRSAYFRGTYSKSAATSLQGQLAFHEVPFRWRRSYLCFSACRRSLRQLFSATRRFAADKIEHSTRVLGHVPSISMRHQFFLLIRFRI